MRVLLMRLESHLMAFGREMVDATGPTREDPDVSMVVGLFANALGFRRTEIDRHQALQDRLRMAARIDRPGHPLQDFQTAHLGKGDRGWTTRGFPEGREGGAATYESPHIRYRFYRADAAVTLGLTLDTPDASPTLDELSAALAEPARPLFIGRKPCLPSMPLFIDLVETPSLLAALDAVPPLDGGERHRYILSRADAAALDSSRAQYGREEQRRTVRRDWVAGVHAGQETRVIVELERAHQ
jgi:CRISPR system Cascade subunit CasD